MRPDWQCVAAAWRFERVVAALIVAIVLSPAGAATFPPEFDPRRMTREEGWLFTGGSPQTGMGNTALGVGDVNGDGLADFIIGTGPYANSESGSYLIYGTTSGHDFSLLPIGGDTVAGRVYIGDKLRFDRIGDFNGDGYDDWLYQPISDTWYQPDDPLESLDAWIVPGQAEPYASPFDIGAVDAVRLIGTYPNGSSYTSRVHPVGDTTGDGLADLLVIDAVDWNQESASAWLVPGRPGELAASIDPADVPESLTTTIRFPNPDQGVHDDYVVAPWEVQPDIGIASGGDINGDGYDDFIVLDTWNGGPGQAYVVYGTAAGLPALIDKDAIDGSNGFWIAGNRVDGIVDGRREFAEIAMVRDTDGDGIDDLLIATRSDSDDTIHVFVMPGRSGNWPARLDVAMLPSIGQFRVEGRVFNSVANAGDINGDGLGDWLMSLDGTHPAGVAVVYGQSGAAADLVIDAISSDRGFTIQPELRMDRYVGFGSPWNHADVGDTDGDGIDDLLLGDGYTIGPVANWADAAGQWFSSSPSTGLAALIRGRVDNGAPVAPAGVYPAYAPALVELRWSLQDATDVARIDVFRDGLRIASLDPGARHYEDTDASRDTTHSYALATIDTAGQRSSRTYRAATNDFSQYPSLAGEVYSSTLAELFWVDDGNDPFYGNREYDIYRDGERVGTRRALSWLDTDYTPTGHHYVIDTNPERFRDDYRLRSDDLYLPPEAGDRAPASVGNPRVTMIAVDTVRVSWDAAAWGVEPLRYELLDMNGDRVGETADTSITDSVAHYDSGLRYGGKIVTIDANGRRSSPMPFYVYLKEQLRTWLPREPIGLSVRGVSESAVTIDWELSHVGTAPVGFEIIRNRGNHELIAQSTTATFTDMDVVPDKQYYYEVRSLDADGYRSLSTPDVVEVVTPGGPIQPTAVRALAYGPTTVEVLWEQERYGYTVIAGYAVYRDGELLDTLLALSYMDRTVEPGTTYTYEVRAVTREGVAKAEGAESATVTTAAR